MTEERARNRWASGRAVGYQSQRSQYLRVILDAEREIARLCGLYEAGVAVDGAVVFHIERVGSENIGGPRGRILGRPQRRQ